MKRSKKVLIVILVIVMVVLLGIAALATAVLAPSSVGVEQAPLDGAYARVLADIEGIRQANPRYIDIACLGSHDSFTADLVHTDDFDLYLPQAVHTFFPIIGKFNFRYTQTQTVGIYQQLMQGVRFLHIKVSYFEDEWYTSHIVMSGKLEKHVLDVLRYLALPEAQGEIVGIIFQPIYMGDKTYNDLRNYVAEIKYEGKSLYDYVAYGEAALYDDGEGAKLSELRYNDLTNSGASAGVLLFERRGAHYMDSWDDGLRDYKHYFDLDSYAIHTWHNHSDRKLLEKCIENTSRQIASSDECNDKLRINQTQASLAVRSAGDLWSIIGERSLLTIAEKHNVALLERDDFMDILRTMPVFQVDYATCQTNDFNARVNQMITQYNVRLVAELNEQRQ